MQISLAKSSHFCHFPLYPDGSQSWLAQLVTDSWASVDTPRNHPCQWPTPSTAPPCHLSQNLRMQKGSQRSPSPIPNWNPCSASPSLHPLKLLVGHTIPLPKSLIKPITVLQKEALPQGNVSFAYTNRAKLLLGSFNSLEGCGWQTRGRINLSEMGSPKQGWF